MPLVELKADIPVKQVDAVDQALLEAGWQPWSVVEDVVASRAWVVGIFPSESEAREGWPAMEELLLAAGVPAAIVPALRELGDADWRDSYKVHFKAWNFGRLHWVPIWERESFQLPSGHAVLWLDPGLAFGTGNHETTRLCVERLVTLAEEFGVRSLEFGVEDRTQSRSQDLPDPVKLGDEPGGPAAHAAGYKLPRSPAREGRDRIEIERHLISRDSVNPVPNSQLQTPGSELRGPRPPRVVDAGCGSGILALSAVLLGFRDVAAFDNDPEAVRVSEENAALNGLAGRVRFREADLTSGLAGEKADLLLANIQADVLIRHARELVAAIAPGGSLVLGGILAGENSEVRTAFEELAPTWAVNARIMNAWSDIVLTRPK